MSLTQIQICNLALSKLGDAAQLTSLSDGSTQAVYCSLFWSQALNVLLNEYAWSFATKTVALTAASGGFVVMGSTMTCTLMGHGLTDGSVYNFCFSDSGYGGDAVTAKGYNVTVTDADHFTLAVTSGLSVSGLFSLVNPFWAYAFVCPADFLGIVELRDSRFSDVSQYPNTETFHLESNVIYSNLPSPVLVYSSSASTNPALFPPMFAEALSVLLAAYLAGPLLKGDQGVAAGQRLMQWYAQALVNATETDAAYRKVRPVYVPSSIRARSGGAVWLDTIVGRQGV